MPSGAIEPVENSGSIQGSISAPFRSEWVFEMKFSFVWAGNDTLLNNVKAGVRERSCHTLDRRSEGEPNSVASFIFRSPCRDRHHGNRRR